MEVAAIRHRIRGKTRNWFPATVQLPWREGRSGERRAV
jgi:hypothetical protein